MNVIDSMAQMSLNGTSTMAVNEHPHIHSHHTQPSSAVEIEPVSQYAPVVVSFNGLGVVGNRTFTLTNSNETMIRLGSKIRGIRADYQAPFSQIL